MTESALGPRRLPFIILASLLILYSCTGLLVDVRGQSNPVVVSQLCRVFVCAENLELQHAYGRFWPEQENSKLLEAAVRQSLIRNPAYPYRWCDLGDVLLASGQTAAARYSFERASQLGPDVPPVLLRLMNFYFRIAENRLALAAASRVLQDTGQYDAIVFSTYARLGLSTGDILRDGVPVQPRPARAFFSHAMSTRPVSETLPAWTWLTSHALADDGLAATFADSLLAQHYYEDAARSWASYVGEHQSGYRKSNFVFNGDFENAWSASPFEWRVAALDGVDVERDGAAARAGRWSLRIRFDGRHNLDYHHISQRVAVSPGAYVL